MTLTTGYELLVAAGAALRDTEIVEYGAEPSADQAGQFLSTNSAALQQARLALQQECAVPLEYNAGFFEKHGEIFAPIINLSRSFRLELFVAARRGDLSTAVDIGLNILHLAGSVRRGGLIVDALLGDCIEGIGVEPLRRVRRRFSATDATRLAIALLKHDAGRESFDDVALRDRRWEVATNYSAGESESPDIDIDALEKDGVDRETAEAVIDLLQELGKLPLEEQRAFQKQADDQKLAIMRLLAIECALLSYHAGEGEYPADLSTLAPDCLTEIPADPFTGESFKYRQTKSGFVVYSPGPTGIDSGGSFGDWWSVLAGQADLGVDLNDYQPACCVEPPRQSIVSRVCGFVRRVFRR